MCFMSYLSYFLSLSLSIYLSIYLSLSPACHTLLSPGLISPTLQSTFSVIRHHHLLSRPSPSSPLSANLFAYFTRASLACQRHYLATCNYLYLKPTGIVGRQTHTDTHTYTYTHIFIHTYSGALFWSICR